MPREIQGDERSRRNQKDFRKRLAEETLQILQQGWYISEGGEHVDISEPLADAMVSSFELREDQAMPPRSGEALARMAMEVTGETSLEALYRLASEDASNLAVLNFASAKNPGGGFLGGAQAQEESLARSSGLFPCLEQFKDSLYARNRKDPRGCLYSDDMIFSPLVPFFRDDEGVLAEQPLLCSVCTSAAPNASQAPHGAAQAAMQGRLRRVLRLLRSQSCQSLVLGAWGCGVFRNDPAAVAQIFRSALALPEFAGVFGRVTFAIPDAQMQEQFAKVLQPLAKAPAAAPAAAPPVAETAETAETAEAPAPAAAPTDAEEVGVEAEADSDEEPRGKVHVKLVSFGYTRPGGLPAADLVVDCRHIANPMKGPKRQLSGLDARLRKEVMSCPGSKELLAQMLHDTLTRCNGEKDTTVAVGCACGQHRSVTFCEELAKALKGQRTPQGRRLGIELEHRERGTWNAGGKGRRWQRGGRASRGEGEGAEDLDDAM